MQSSNTRLDRFLANMGYASRRGVDAFLIANNVQINNLRVTEPGERFNPRRDKITINGESLEAPNPTYIILNKPEGYVTTTKPQAGEKTVMKLIKSTEKIVPVGRLDIDTTGLLLLTNDGDLTFRLTHPKFHIPKTYRLTIKDRLTSKQFHLLKTGVRLKDFKTAPADLQIIDKTDDATTLDLTISEGKNRQIRRMCKAIGIHLISLSRISMGPLALGDLRLGSSRELTEEEIVALKAAK